MEKMNEKLKAYLNKKLQSIKNGKRSVEIDREGLFGIIYEIVNYDYFNRTTINKEKFNLDSYKKLYDDYQQEIIDTIQKDKKFKLDIPNEYNALNIFFRIRYDKLFEEGEILKSATYNVMENNLLTGEKLDQRQVNYFNKLSIKHWANNSGKLYQNIFKKEIIEDSNNINIDNNEKKLDAKTFESSLTTYKLMKDKIKNSTIGHCLAHLPSYFKMRSAIKNFKNQLIAKGIDKNIFDQIDNNTLSLEDAVAKYKAANPEEEVKTSEEVKTNEEVKTSEEAVKNNEKVNIYERGDINNLNPQNLEDIKKDEYPSFNRGFKSEESNKKTEHSIPIKSKSLLKDKSNGVVNKSSVVSLTLNDNDLKSIKSKIQERLNEPWDDEKYKDVNENSKKLAKSLAKPTKELLNNKFKELKDELLKERPTIEKNTPEYAHLKTIIQMSLEEPLHEKLRRVKHEESLNKFQKIVEKQNLSNMAKKGSSDSKKKYEERIDYRKNQASRQNTILELSNTINELQNTYNEMEKIEAEKEELTQRLNEYNKIYDEINNEIINLYKGKEKAYFKENVEKKDLYNEAKNFRGSYASKISEIQERLEPFKEKIYTLNSSFDKLMKSYEKLSGTKNVIKEIDKLYGKKSNLNEVFSSNELKIQRRNFLQNYAEIRSILDGELGSIKETDEEYEEHEKLTETDKEQEEQEKLTETDKKQEEQKKLISSLENEFNSQENSNNEIKEEKRNLDIVSEIKEEEAIDITNEQVAS